MQYVIGRIKGLGVTSSSDWRNEGFDSARGLHPPWADAQQFTEFCLKNEKKCSVRKVTVTDGNVENAGGVGAVVVSTNDKEWENLKELPNRPTFAIVRNAVGKRLNRRVGDIEDGIPGREPNTRQYKLLILLTSLLYLVSFSAQVSNVVVQREYCGYSSASIDSLGVFLFLLTAARIGFIGLLVYDGKKSDIGGDFLSLVSLAMIFFIEMPLMVSDAYVVKTCGKVDNLTLGLHVTYFVNTCIQLTSGPHYDYFANKDINLKGLCGRIVGAVVVAICLYVPVYLAFADKPYDFKMDVKKIDSESFPAAHFLVGLGTVGWGFWVVVLSIIALAIVLSCCGLK